MKYLFATLNAQNENFMKDWTKPQIFPLESGLVRSGDSSHGAEQVLTCNGALVPGGVIVIFPDDCFSNNPDGTYYCTGFGTQNSVVYVFTTGEQATINQVCS